jgi:hypothetical protein
MLARFILKAADAETERRMMVAAIALERYRLRNGKYPATLADLTPEILPKVPIDFMDGKPLRYQRRDDGTFLLYSAGEDGKDGGGDGSSPPSATANFWPLRQTRDLVWPIPATPEEVKKYEAQALAKLDNKPRGRRGSRGAPPPPARTNSATN